MVMKRVYVKPSIEGQRIDTNYGILTGASGEIDPGDAMAKNQDFEEEKEETGIPTGFTNIWGDEEEEE